MVYTSWADKIIFKGFSLWDGASIWSDTIIFKGSPFGAVYDTWCDAYFFNEFILGDIDAKLNDKYFTRGYLFGPYLPHGLTHILQRFTPADTYFCTASPLGAVASTWYETHSQGIPLQTHILKGFPLGTVSSTMTVTDFARIPPSDTKLYKWFYLGSIAATWNERLFWKGLSLGDIAVTWADTVFAKGSPCRHKLLQGVNPGGRFWHMRRHNFYRGSLLEDISDTWYDTKFIIGFPIRAVASSGYHTDFSRGSLMSHTNSWKGFSLGPYLSKELTKILQGFLTAEINVVRFPPLGTYLPHGMKNCFEWAFPLGDVAAKTYDTDFWKGLKHVTYMPYGMTPYFSRGTT